MTAQTAKLLEIAAARPHRLVRRDNWQNPLTGLGTSRDKTRAARFRLGRLLQPEEIDQYLVGNDLLETIASAIVEDAMREGFQLREAEDPDAEYDPLADDSDKEAAAADVEQQIKDLDGPSKLLEAAVWGRAYGRSALVLIAAGDPETPFASGEVLDLWIADKRELTPWTWYRDPTQPKFGQPETYLLCPTISGDTQPQYFPIHETRLVLFGGMRTPKRIRNINDNADVSVLQPVIDVVRAADGNWDAACHMLTDGSQGVLKIKGLIAAVAAKKSEVIAERLAFMDQMRSVVRSLPLDADGEEFDYKQRSWSGIPDFLVQTWTRVAAAGKIPMTRLFRSFPGGLNSGAGDGDARWWYDDVRAFQRDVLGPAIVRLATVLSPGKKWEVCWPDLEKPTPDVEAAVRKAVAETDAIYLSNDVLLPGQIARCRFGKGKWTPGYDGIDLEAQEASLEREIDHKIEGTEEPTMGPDGKTPLPNPQAEVVKPGAAAKPPAK